MHVCPAFAHFPQSIRFAVISMLTVLSIYTGLKKITHGLTNYETNPITHNLLICSIQTYVAPVLSNSRSNFFFFYILLLCITIQLLQFKPTNALYSTTITIKLQYTRSYKFWASVAYHQGAYNCTK